MRDKIEDFVLVGRQDGRLFFNHCFSNNCVQVPATSEQMRHFHIGEHYDLHVTPEMFHRKRDERAA